MRAMPVIFLLYGLILHASAAPADRNILQVKSFTPTGEVEDVRQIVIEFDRPVTRLGEFVSKGQLAHIDIKPALKCEWRWLGLDRLACELPMNATPASATEYIVKVLSGFQSFTGARNVSTAEFRFSTSRPEINYVRLARYEKPGLPVFEMASHRHRLVPESLRRRLYFRGEGGRKYPASLKPSEERGNSGSEWTVVPTTELPQGADYSLVLDAGLKSYDGPLESVQEKILQSFKTYPTFRAERVECAHALNDKGKPEYLAYRPESSPPCLYDYVRMKFTAPVNPRRVRAALDAPLKISDEDRVGSWMEETVHLDGLLAPGSSNRLRLAAGAEIKDQFGRPLSETFEMTVQTAALEENIHPVGDFVLELGETTDLPVVLANVKTAGIEGRLHTSSTGKKSRAVPRYEFWQGGTDNRWQVADTGIRKLFGGDSGYFTGTAASAGKSIPLHVQVTPFNIAVFPVASGYEVWVVRLADAAPMPDAVVRIYSSKDGLPLENARAKSFKTDASGLVFIPNRDIKVPFFKDYKSAPRLIVEAAKDGHSGYLSLAAGEWVLYHTKQRSLDSLRATPDSVLNAWTLFSQPLYQPGDSVSFKVYARDLSREGYKTPVTKDAWISVEYEGYDQTGYVEGFNRRKIVWNDFGTFSSEFELPGNAPHGNYYVTVGMDGDEQGVQAGEFRVAEFNKLEFELELGADKTVMRPGERATVTTQASLQNGGPYGGAPATLTATLSPEDDLFEDDPVLEDFYFQPAEESVKDEPILFEVHGSTDARGGFRHSFVPAGSGIYYGNIYFESSVEDARGKAIYESRSAPYFAVDRLIGVKFSERQIAAGESVEAQVLAIDAAGRKPAAAIPVTLRIEHDVLRQGYGNNYRREDKYSWRALKSCALRTAAEAASCEFQPLADGYYRITAEIRDTRGREHVSSRIAWINVTRSTHEVAPVFELQTPEQAQVGDTLEFSIESRADAATALVSIQRNEILQTSVHSLRKGRNAFSMEITPAMAPGVYLTVSVQKPRTDMPEVAGPGNFDGALPFLFNKHRLIKIEDPKSTIGLDVQSDRKTYAPGDRIALTLTAATGNAGEPVELSVAVVDQALLQLYDGDAERFYDVRSGFQFPYRSSFRFDSAGCHDLTPWLVGYGYRGTVDYYDADPALLARFDLNCIANPSALQRVSGVLMAADIGVYEEVQVFGIRGSIMEPAYARKDFRDLAFWLAARTVTGGKPETVEFRLPDNLTRWRLFVLAADKGGRFGMASTDIITEKMTEVRSALPNRLIEGDELSARFTVFNRAAQPRRLNYTSKVEGALQADAGAGLEGVLKVAPSERAVVEFGVKATGAGTATLTFGAGDDLDKDTLERTVPVSSRALAETAFLRGEIGPPGAPQDPLSIPMQAPANALEDLARLSLSFNVSRLDDIVGALQYGRDYPYTCWEQKLTRAVLAALYRRAPGYIRAQLPWSESETLVADTLAEAAGFQHYEGGMTFFGPASGEPSRYLSAYTLLAFSWLRQWGYEVPLQVEEPLLEYLAGAHDDKTIRGEDDSIGLALPLLLERELIEPDEIERVLPSPAQSSTLEIVQRLAVLASMKTGESYRDLLESLDRQAYRDLHAYSFPLASNAVAQCSLLSLLAGNPDFFKGQDGRIEHLADSTRKLIRSRGHWRNTQENIFCAKALLDHDRYFNSERTDLTITVNAGDSSRTVLLKGDAPKMLELEPGKPGGSTEISLSAAGRGKAYYTARLDYVRDAGEAAAESQGFAIQRSYKIRQGAEWVELAPGAALQRGQLVRVDLTVWAPADRALVAVVDPLPGNLEAQNPSFSTSRMPRDEYGYEEGEYGYADYIFYQRELGLQSVRFYSQHVPAGEYRLQYTAQVIAAGRFTALPPTVEEMYAPEVYGRGAATVLLSE